MLKLLYSLAVQGVPQKFANKQMRLRPTGTWETRGNKVPTCGVFFSRVSASFHCAILKLHNVYTQLTCVQF